VPLVAGVLAALILAVAFFVNLRPGLTGSSSSTVATSSSLHQRGNEVETDSAAFPPETRRPMPAAAESEDSEAHGLRTDDLRAEIRGRFVSLDGAPISDVSISLSGHSLDGDAASAQVALQTSDISAASSDQQGKFSIVFVPSRALQYDLAATHEAFCPVRWSWDSIDAGDTRYLGLILLQRGGIIEGRVLGPGGRAMPGGAWTVTADQPMLGIATGRSTVHVTARTNAGTGAFVLRDVPPGLTQFRADREGTSRFTGPVLDVRSDETMHVDLECPDPSAASRISVRVSCPPYMSGPYASVRSSQIDAIALSGVGRSQIAEPPKGSNPAFSFEGLDPGRYTFRVQDPRYLPWSSESVEPGSVVEARLKGSASIRLTLTDATSGAPIDRCSVHAEVLDPEWRSRMSSAVPLCQDCDFTRTSGVVGGLLPIDQVLTVSVPGYADACVHETPLSPGDVRDVHVSLSRGATLSGRVFENPQRTPAKHATVRLLPMSSNESERSKLIEDSSHVLATMTEGADGRFAFDHLRPGVYRVQATSSRAVYSPIAEVRVVRESAPSDVELVLPSATRLRGRVLAPSGASFAELNLLLACEGFPLTQAGIIPNLEWRQKLAITIRADGRYESGPLPIGVAHVKLICPDSDLPWAFAGARHSAGSEVDLGMLVLSPWEWNERDFDLRDSFPGTIEVALELNRPALDCVVEAFAVDANHLWNVSGAVMQRGEEVRIGPVAPGDYAIVVRSLEESWNWISPNNVHVNPGQESMQRCRIDLFEGVLKLRSEGEASHDFPKGVVVRLDSPLEVEKLFLNAEIDGTIRLVLPVGRYSIRCQVPAQGRPAGSTDANNAVPRAAPSAVLFFDWPIANEGAAEIVFPKSGG
jgi:hypothetical protein